MKFGRTLSSDGLSLILTSINIVTFNDGKNGRTYKHLKFSFPQNSLFTDMNFSVSERADPS